MNEEIINLWCDLLRLAEAQRKALSEGRLDEALELQERRQNIVGKIQRIDSNLLSPIQTNRSSVGKNDPGGEDFSQQIPMIVKKIALVDDEMCSNIQAEIGSISNKLSIIQKAKAFHHNVLHRSIALSFYLKA